jgi:hypothetical protein
VETVEQVTIPWTWPNATETVRRERTPTSSKPLQAGAIAGDRYAKPVEVVENGTHVSAPGN